MGRQVLRSNFCTVVKMWAGKRNIVCKPVSPSALSRPLSIYYPLVKFWYLSFLSINLFLASYLAVLHWMEL